MISFETLIASFSAGLISFVAPCLLPLLPTYFSVITGFTFSDLYGLDISKIRGRVFLSSLFFSLGFSLVFTLLGATGSIVGRLLEDVLPLLLRTSGLFLIILGLMQLGLIRFETLQFDFAWNIQKRLTKLGYVTALVTGVAAALSWIPCVGPLLAPILLLSAQSDTVAQGSIFLFVYSLGLTLPFIITGIFFPSIATKMRENRLLLHRLSQGAGVVLIVFGFILLLDQYRYFIQLFSFIRIE